MKEGNMPKINLSLPKKEYDEFTKLSEKERRPYNQQFMHMMEFYLRNKDKMK